MKPIIFSITAFLILVFWPLSLILANQNSWPIYIFPTMVVLLSYLLYRFHFSAHHLVLLLIPLAIGYFSPKSFFTYSIFTSDPLKFDTLIKKINLIPNRNLARVFENKATVPFEKYMANFFLETDLNNYFFSLHPREIIGTNQGLQKFPFLTIVPFLLGLFLLPYHKDRNWIVTVLALSILSLCFINNPDKFDFILYLPLSLISFIGLKELLNRYSLATLFLLILFLPISLFELARVIIKL